jgi:DNA-binding response OmpR family regulator
LAVLVIEDDLPIQQLLCAVIVRNHLTPVVAGDGRTAITILHEREFGAVLLDLLLPDVDPFDVIDHIARKRSDLLGRVIVMTAATDAVWGKCPYLDRVRAFTMKPFDVSWLEKQIVDCCRAH